jgi:hypothetical protein
MAYDDPGNVQTSRAELFKKWTHAEEAHTRDMIWASADHFCSVPPPVLSEAELRTMVDARAEADRAAGDALRHTRNHGESGEAREPNWANLITGTPGWPASPRSKPTSSWRSGRRSPSS